VCANDVDRPLGTVVYTQMLNRRGGIEADVTVTRLAEDRYRIITGTASGTHDLAWLQKRLRDGSERVQLRDVTSSLACLGLWGPLARDVLSAACADDLSNDAFPFMTAREITVGDVPCLGLRVTYVGELGWELYPPVEFGATLWDALMRAGARHGMVPAGYRAIDSLRLEKGYRAWGSDVTGDDTTLEASLGLAVARGKDFHGRQALDGVGTPARTLRCLALADVRSMALGNEPVRRGDRVVSRVTSGGIGYTVGRSIAFAYLPSELAAAGTELTVDVFGERIGALVVDDPLYDPKGDRIRS
jgi:4-methylaminobutanoate oxidase (formaldehyde-forming)